MKRLRKSNSNLDKCARCELAPNLIPLDEIEECIELKGRDELLDPDKYEKVSGNEYADAFAYGATAVNNAFQCCLIEYHEYKCIDKDDPNYGKSFTVVAGCPMNEKTHAAESGFVNIEIMNGTVNEVKNKSEIGKYRIFESKPGILDGDYERCKRNVTKEISNGGNPYDSILIP